MNELIAKAIEAAYAGGVEILDVYQSDFAIETKDDKSPLTLADRRAHEAIMHHLKGTGLPVLSEEGRSIPYGERASWERFWMVDPLDGTKEFIKRNGEFTVNIALIERGVPLAGVIYVPVKGVLYFGMEGFGAYKLSIHGTTQNFDPIALASVATRLPAHAGKRRFTAVGSRSHMSPETEAYFAELRIKHGDFDVISMGSSLKICLVAEGAADVYPRFAPTMEWDTAAGHGIVRAAGKEIIDYTTSKPMVYNKENLLNNWFIVN